MKNLDRAIDLAEEHCGTPFWEARDELEATRVKTRAFDLLWERAHTVIATFEALGKTRSVPEQLTLPCEVCGATKAQAHHCNYSKPLDVRWLCPKHHAEWHKHNTPLCPDQEQAA